MSRQLIESIVSNNMLEANDMVEAKLAEIRERKIYEMKRMFAAKMDEAFGGLTNAEIEARKKAGYKKASEVLGDPRDKKSEKLNPGAKILKKKVAEQTLDEIRTPGEVPGSEERKQDAAKLRAARSGLRALDIGKEGRQKFTKDYLSARRAQMAPGASASQKEPDSSPEDKIDPHAKGWSDLASKLDRKQKQQPIRDRFLRSKKLLGWKIRQGIGAAKQGAAQGAVNAAKYVGKDIISGGPIKRALKAPVVQDFKDIGFRNL